ncbi:MAG: acetate--CoA ligase family protein, partial [Anaerolineae bacterium]|nr:acetate--CoA ligase family protein [Anaerolineae bacterium]
MENRVLDGLFRPQSLAVIGASATEGKIGHSVISNIIDGKYAGKVYPVNKKETEIMGLPCYASVQDIPGPVDAAVITIPAGAVPEILHECGKKGVKGLIIITSGFGEVGNRDLENEIVKTANSYGMRILGPNIVGVLSNSDNMNASFAPFLPLNGKASLVSQSGALLIAIDASSYTRRVGFDKLISIGNMSDVDFADSVNWLNEDPNTSCISLYIEGFKDGRKFIEAGKKAKKPIIALKSGVSAHGAAAAASHTGSLAGAAKVYGAAFQQAGVVQATDLGNLFDRTLALSLEPPLKGDNLLIITNGGGVGVLATDAAERFDIPLKYAPADLQDELKKHMPPFGSAKNPVDLTGMAGIDWYVAATRFALSHDWTDGVVVLYCETAMTDPMEIAKGIHTAHSEAGKQDKPITVSFVGGERSEAAMAWLVENGIPAYPAPDTAINAMAALREYAQIQSIISEETDGRQSDQKDVAIKIIDTARKEGRDSLTEIEAKEVFAAYGLPVTATKLATSEDAAVQLAEEIGFPVVMKIVSPDILHKSDAGGVKVNIKDSAEVRSAYNTILANAKAYKASANIHGIAIQEMAPWGTEVILGSVNDPTFGPTMMFGLGGIFVEVLKDVTFRVAPVATNQALRMLSEIRGAPILQGVRGEQPRDRAALADTICKYSNMVLDLSSEISESDANPVLVYEEGKG